MISRQDTDDKGGHGHHDHCKSRSLLPSGPVTIRSDHDGPQGSHKKSDGKSGKRRHQRDNMAFRDKKIDSEDGGEVAVDAKVKPLYQVAHGGCRNCLPPLFSSHMNRSFSHLTHLPSTASHSIHPVSSTLD